MNTNGLAKHYGTLSPWERVSLLVAAEARGDVQEQGRLARSAPKVSWAVCDYFGLFLGLDRVAMNYAMRQLALAVPFREGVHVLDFLEAHTPAPLPTGEANLPALYNPRDRDRRRAERVDRLGDALRFLAYRIVGAADAWQLLCARLGIDPDTNLRSLPGYDIIRATEEEAREWAFTETEAADFIKERFREGGTEAALPTAKAEAREMLDFLTEQLKDWAPEAPRRPVEPAVEPPRGHSALPQHDTTPPPVPRPPRDPSFSRGFEVVSVVSLCHPAAGGPEAPAPQEGLATPLPNEGKP
jgi:hypothetical protein